MASTPFPIGRGNGKVDQANPPETLTLESFNMAFYAVKLKKTTVYYKTIWIDSPTKELALECVDDVLYSSEIDDDWEFDESEEEMVSCDEAAG